MLLCFFRGSPWADTPFFFFFFFGLIHPSIEPTRLPISTNTNTIQYYRPIYPIFSISIYHSFIHYLPSLPPSLCRFYVNVALEPAIGYLLFFSFPCFSFLAERSVCEWASIRPLSSLALFFFRWRGDLLFGKEVSAELGGAGLKVLIRNREREGE